MPGETDSALTRIVELEEELGELVGRARTRAEAMIAEARRLADARRSREREGIEADAAALARSVAAERERRLAGIRERGRRELARFTAVEEGTVEELAALVVARVAADGEA